MKNILLLLSLSCSLQLQAQTKPGNVTRCISGDCKDGNGEALVSEVANGSGQVWYRGHFKDGLMDGDGEMAGYGKFYIGHFKKGLKDGNFSIFGLKWDGDHPLPDSTTNVSFANYDGEYDFESILVYPDGNQKSISGEDHYHKKFDPFKTVKNKWINTQVENFLAARAGKFAPSPKPIISKQPAELAIRKANTARDQWIETIQWDCLPDRLYYITATPQTKYHAMPFAGHLTVQVIAPDNTVAYEGELGNYWTPRMAGKYTFLIKFYQDKIYGGDGSNYVSGLRIEWTLYSKINP